MILDRDFCNLALIHAIKSRPILYSKKAKSSSEARAESWIELAIELKLPADVLKAKWKNLRSSYLKYLKSIITNDENVSRFKRWPWGKLMMEILDPHLSVEVIEPTSKSKLPADRHNVKQCEENSKDDRSGSDDDNTDSSSQSEENMIESTTSNNVQSNKKLDEIDLLFLKYSNRIKAFSYQKQATTMKQIETIISENERLQQESEQNDVNIFSIVSLDDDDPLGKKPLTKISSRKRSAEKQQPQQRKSSRRQTKRKIYQDSVSTNS